LPAVNTPELLIWTENYSIGGCDRFLVDLIHGLELHTIRISLAGNVHPEFDTWLAVHVPEALPRETLPIANLVQSRLHAVEERLRGSPSPDELFAAAEAPVPGPLARHAAVAAIRYAQGMVNFQRLRALFRRRRPGVLLINNGAYPGGESCRVAALAAHAAGVPRIIHLVHNVARPLAWPVAVEHRLDRRIDAVTDVWITPAERASDALAARRPIPRHRIRTVHYGLPPTTEVRGVDPRSLRAELGFRDDTLALVAVAGLEPRKGLNVLLDALALLRHGEVPVRAAIVGTGPLYEALTTRADELALDQDVRFMGWRDDVDQILSVSNVLVLPSLSHEALPYVILEAMARSLPVISTDVAGIPELVLDGVTGRILPPGDAAGLALALRDLAVAPDRRREMGERGHQRLLERFTVERMTLEMAQLIGLPD
jgi:glycosyltransferase involved in cell wall biosynthesis